MHTVLLHNFNKKQKKTKNTSGGKMQMKISSDNKNQLCFGIFAFSFAIFIQKQLNQRKP